MPWRSRLLAAAEKQNDEWTERLLNQSPGSGLGNPPGHWIEWIESQLLCREARQTIQGKATVADPRLRILEKRALNELRGED